MNFFLLTLTILLSYFESNAQNATDSVKAVINNFFVGMKAADTIMIKQCIAVDIILQTIVQKKDGIVEVKNENVNAFIGSIASLPKAVADERIVFETVKTDGSLAIAWVPYQFYFKEKFSHCGVNSFQLVRLNGQWKIQYIIDTRRKSGCF